MNHTNLSSQIQGKASSQVIAGKLVMVNLGGKQHRQPNHDAGIIHIA